MPSSGSEAYARREPRGLVLELHVQPGARRDEIVGEHGGRLKLKLAAPPVDGKANRHLVQFLAGLFAVPTGRVQLLRGAAGRIKTVLIEGANDLPASLAKIRPS